MATTSQVPDPRRTLRRDVAACVGIGVLLGLCTAFAGPRWGVVAALILVIAAVFALSMRSALFLLAAIIPLQITIDVPGFGVQPTLVGALAMLAICLAAIIRSGCLKKDPSKLGAWFLLFFGIAVFSALFGLSPRWSITRLIHICSYAGFFFSTFWLLRGTEDTVRLVRLMMAVAVVVGIIGIGLHSVQFIVGKSAAEDLFVSKIAPILLGAKRASVIEIGTIWAPGVRGAPLRAFGPFFWPPFFAMYIELMLPLFLASMAFLPRTKARWWDATGACVLIFCVAACFVRGAWATFPFAALTMIIVARQAKLQARRRTVTILAIGALAVFLTSAFAGQGSLTNRLATVWQPNYASNIQRIRIWTDAIRIIADNPVLGVGPGNFAAARRGRASEELARPYVNAHNMYLTVASEMGLIGLAALVGFLARLLWCAAQVARRAASPESKALAVGLVGSFVWLSLNSLTDDGFYEHRLFAVFWVLAGLIAVMYRSVREKTTPR